jgi:hypothetical protein
MELRDLVIYRAMSVRMRTKIKNKIQYYCPYERAIRSNSRTGSLYLANDLLYLGQLSTTG